MKKISLEGLEGKSLELAEQNNAIVDKLISLEQKGVDITALENRLKAVEGLEVKAYDTEIASFKTALDALEKKSIQNIEVVAVNAEQYIQMQLEKKGIKSMDQLMQKVIENKRIDIDLDLKAIAPIASTANTDTIGRTNLDTMVSWTPTVAAAFLPFLRTVSEASNKSYFGYTEGSYTGKTKYVGEGTGTDVSDEATASATTMDYAKYQTLLTTTVETYEDIPEFAAGLIPQMRIADEKFLDDQLIRGDGGITGIIRRIKGIDAYATAWVATPYAATVQKPHIGNLVDAMCTTISMEDGVYSASHVFIHPLDLYKYRNTQDADGNPVVSNDVNGNALLNGLRVVATKKVAKDTLRVIDANVFELRTKRQATLRIGQFLANDAINDTTSAMLISRKQLLCRNLDKVAVLKCASIATALGVLEIV